MNQVRLHGDPYGEDAAASRLRSFLRLAVGCGMRCSLSVTDGAGRRREPKLPPAELDALSRVAGESVAATAPVVVFADQAEACDALQRAGLGWPHATAVFVARELDTAAELLDRVRAELRWAGADDPPHALDGSELAPWFALPAAAAGGTIVHLGSADPADGTDLVVEAWSHGAADGARLRLVLPDADDAAVAAIGARLAGHPAASFEIVRGSFAPAHVRDAAAIVLPWREVRSTRALVQALASGRAVCVSRFAGTACLVGRGTCLPIGGRLENGRFEPDPRAVVAVMRRACDAAVADAVGRCARQHVQERLVRGAPAAPPSPFAAPRPGRPSVVLEAPFLAQSRDAEAAIATARALVRAGNVDVRLVPAPPTGDLAALRRRAPELVPLLTRAPGRPDLWLSSGAPLRAARPDCGTWALCVDPGSGALPIEATPHVTQEADLVIVPSEPAGRAVLDAGRSMASVRVVPPGVDEAMHDATPPDAGIVAWKGARRAVLFGGALDWRDGFDVFLAAVLGARATAPDLCVVVRVDGRFAGEELLRPFDDTPGAPLRIVDGDWSRERLASLYTACDVLVHPSRDEAFAVPVLEARACGLPVLATGGGATDALLVGPGAVRIPAARCCAELPAPHVTAPVLLEPPPADTGRLLVEMLHTIGEHRAAARGFARAVRAAFPWPAAAEAIEREAFAAMHARRGAAVRAATERTVVLPVAAPSPLPAAPVPVPT